jgi:uncharacterized protein
MKINVKRIPVGGETLRGTDPGGIMELDEPDVRFQSDVEYELLAQVQDNSLLVTGTLRTPATLRCSRCLRIFQQELWVRQFVFHERLAGGDFVDLTARIREDILLELPQRALCDARCRGLCPVCGQDLNEATCSCKPAAGSLRWQALDRIKLD